MLELDLGMIIWTWAAFLVLLLVLYKTAWKPILSTIDKREKTIQESLDRAEEAKQESEALMEKHQQMMLDAEQQAQNIIKENKELAEKSRLDIINQAQEESQKMIEKAKAEILREGESALIALRAEVVDLALGAARKVIGELKDESQQRQVIDDYLKTMSSSEKN